MAAVKVKMSEDSEARDLKEKVDQYDEQLRELEIECDRLQERKDILTLGVIEEEEEGA